MGQKHNSSENKNLLIDFNPISNSYYELYLYNFKTSKNYKSLLSSSVTNEMFKIKNKSKLIKYIKTNSEIKNKQSNSIILSFNLENKKYQIELYDINNYKNIIYLLTTLDYLFISLILISLLSVFQYSKSYPYFSLRLLHFLIMAILVGVYGLYRYYQIFECYYYKLDYKYHFYYMLYFLGPVLINIISFIGVIFITTNDMENLCLMGCLGLDGSILYFWVKEQFEKNTYKDMKKYFFEVKKNIIKYIKK